MDYNSDINRREIDMELTHVDILDYGWVPKLRDERYRNVEDTAERLDKAFKFKVRHDGLRMMEAALAFDTDVTTNKPQIKLYARTVREKDVEGWLKPNERMALKPFQRHLQLCRRKPCQPKNLPKQEQ